MFDPSWRFCAMIVDKHTHQVTDRIPMEGPFNSFEGVFSSFKTLAIDYLEGKTGNVLMMIGANQESALFEMYAWLDSHPGANDACETRN